MDNEKERKAFVDYWFTGMSEEYKERHRDGFWLTCNWTTEKARAWKVWQTRAALPIKKLTDQKISHLWYMSRNDLAGNQAGFTTQEHYFAHLLINELTGCPQPTMPQPETNCPRIDGSKLSGHDQVTRDEFDQEAM